MKLFSSIFLCVRKRHKKRGLIIEEKEKDRSINTNEQNIQSDLSSSQIFCNQEESLIYKKSKRPLKVNKWFKKLRTRTRKFKRASKCENKIEEENNEMSKISSLSEQNLIETILKEEYSRKDFPQDSIIAIPDSGKQATEIVYERIEQDSGFSNYYKDSLEFTNSSVILYNANVGLKHSVPFLKPIAQKLLIGNSKSFTRQDISHHCGKFEESSTDIFEIQTSKSPSIEIDEVNKIVDSLNNDMSVDINNDCKNCEEFCNSNFEFKYIMFDWQNENMSDSSTNSEFIRNHSKYISTSHNEYQVTSLTMNSEKKLKMNHSASDLSDICNNDEYHSFLLNYHQEDSSKDLDMDMKYCVNLTKAKTDSDPNINYRTNENIEYLKKGDSYSLIKMKTDSVNFVSPLSLALVSQTDEKYVSDNRTDSSPLHTKPAHELLGNIPNQSDAVNLKTVNIGISHDVPFYIHRLPSPDIYFSNSNLSYDCSRGEHSSLYSGDSGFCVDKIHSSSEGFPMKKPKTVSILSNPDSLISNSINKTMELVGIAYKSFEYETKIDLTYFAKTTGWSKNEVGINESGYVGLISGLYFPSISKLSQRSNRPLLTATILSTWSSNFVLSIPFPLPNIRYENSEEMESNSVSRFKTCYSIGVAGLILCLAVGAPYIQKLPNRIGSINVLSAFASNLAAAGSSWSFFKVIGKTGAQLRFIRPA